MVLALAEAGADKFLALWSIADTTAGRTIQGLGQKVEIYVVDLVPTDHVSGLTRKNVQDGHQTHIVLNYAGVQRSHPRHHFHLELE